MYSLVIILLLSTITTAQILECRKRDILSIIGSNPSAPYTTTVLTSAVKMPDFLNELFVVETPSYAIGGKITYNGEDYGFV